VTNLPEVNLGNDTSICDGDVIMLDAGNPTFAHYWSNGEQAQTVDVETFPTIVWVAVDRNGCMAKDSIALSSACSVFVPNVFTPNGDGIRVRTASDQIGGASPADRTITAIRPSGG